MPLGLAIHTIRLKLVLLQQYLQLSLIHTAGHFPRALIDAGSVNVTLRFEAAE